MRDALENMLRNHIDRLRILERRPWPEVERMSVHEHLNKELINNLETLIRKEAY